MSSFTTIKELDDLWDTRCCLEAVAARLAANFITDSDIRRLRVLCRRRERAAELNDVRGVNQADIAFHRHIVTMSRNLVIQHVFGSTRLLERVFEMRGDNFLYDVDLERSAFGHHQIVEALNRRDPELSERLVTQHIQAAKVRALEPLDGKAQPSRAKVRTKKKRKTEGNSGSEQ